MNTVHDLTAFRGMMLMVLALGAGPFAGRASAQFNINTIALSGTTGNTLGLGPSVEAGIFFGGFELPVINSAGQVAFVGNLNGPGLQFDTDRGIWTTASGALTAVARAGPQGPGPNLGAGVNFSGINIRNPVINSAGRVAFRAFLTGTGVSSANDDGVFTNASGTMTAVARDGAGGPGPNLGAGINFFSLNIPVLNNDGRVAFTGALTGTGVNVDNNAGVFTNASGTLTAVARSGAAGPGPNLGAGVDFTSSFGNPVINSAGRVAFSGRLTGTGVDTTNNLGIWTNASGTLTAVARSGASGPGPNLGAGVNFSAFSTAPVLNGAGQVAFSATISGTGVDLSNNTGIWTNASGTLTAVAREGAGGPGPNLGAGVNFTVFGNPVINSAGRVAFVGNLAGAGVDTTNDSGIWSDVSGTLTAVARKGASGPGPNLGAGINFNSFGTPVLNGAGQMAFFASVTGPGVNSTNNRGIWTDVSGTLTKVVLLGDVIDVDPSAGTDLRTVSSINNFDATATSFSDTGWLTAKLDFADGSSGVFTFFAPVPEPMSVLGMCAAVVAGGLVRRKRRAAPDSQVSD